MVVSKTTGRSVAFKAAWMSESVLDAQEMVIKVGANEEDSTFEEEKEAFDDY